MFAYWRIARKQGNGLILIDMNGIGSLTRVKLRKKVSYSTRKRICLSYHLDIVSNQDEVELHFAVLGEDFLKNQSSCPNCAN
jgi:hypothetical protein